MRCILICGSRGWQAREPIRNWLRQFDPASTLIVEGGAPGADRIGAEVASRMGFHVAEIRALWHRHGRKAGPIRNTAVLDALPIAEVAAFSLGTPGTEHMVAEARKRGIPVEVFDGEVAAA